uniref:heparan sulfate glucosamine 3-O-sulfotransferase 1-like isoform X1 n=1 Tax=Styela clava TaxID=7725 RepID=UPI00193A1709|nr:heparan sulfate glucosamine 3-O-sulfotransferase 1-like isoform X1 [Styela clava]
MMRFRGTTILLVVVGLLLIYNFVRVLLNSPEEKWSIIDLSNQDGEVAEVANKNVHYFTTKASKLQIRKMGYKYEKRLPKVLGIGVKKCGTTALMRFLDLHPDIVLPNNPELHFFDTSDYKKGTEFYRSKMPYTAPHEITMEKSPRYFVLRDVPLNVKRMNPNMKLILVVCDPIKRAYSDFNFESHRTMKSLLRIQKNIPAPSNFDDFVKDVLKYIKENERVLRRYFPSIEEQILNSWSTSRYYLTILNTGIYSVYLKNWLKYFPLEQIHIINGEDLLTDPVKVVQDTQKFLGLEIKVDERDIVFDKAKGYHCIRVHRKDNAVQCLADTKGTTRNKTISGMMSKETLNSLKKFYNKYNEELFEIINKRFNWT